MGEGFKRLAAVTGLAFALLSAWVVFGQPGHAFRIYAYRLYSTGSGPATVGFDLAICAAFAVLFIAYIVVARHLTRKVGGDQRMLVGGLRCFLLGMGFLTMLWVDTFVVFHTSLDSNPKGAATELKLWTQN